MNDSIETCESANSEKIYYVYLLALAKFACSQKKSVKTHKSEYSNLLFQ